MLDDGESRYGYVQIMTDLNPGGPKNTDPISYGSTTLACRTKSSRFTGGCYQSFKEPSAAAVFRFATSWICIDFALPDPGVRIGASKHDIDKQFSI